MAFKDILQGRFMNHPLHPLFVHIPVGLWVTSLIFDIVYLSSDNANFAVASYYCMLVGLISVVLAAPTGFAEYASIPARTRPKQIATTHMLMNLSITVLYLINLLARYNSQDTVPTFVTTGQFIFSIVCVVLLGISGYLGGLLVYSYGVGFRASGRDRTDVRRAA